MNNTQPPLPPGQRRPVTLLATLMLLCGCLVSFYGCNLSSIPAPQPLVPTVTALPLPTATPMIEQTSVEHAQVATATRPRPTASPSEPRRISTSTATQEPPPPAGWREVVRVAPGKKEIALTFDAGASGDPLPLILKALRDRHLHVTMFFTGKFAERYPEGLRQAVADGHEIGNHTYSHLDSTKLTDSKIKEELERTDAIIDRIAGIGTKPYWRPPLGARNNHVLNVAVSEGYRSIYWTLDSLDSVGKPKTPDFIFNRVTNTPNVDLDGAIVLQHFGSEPSALALPRILDKLDEMGLRVVTVSELLSSP